MSTVPHSVPSRLSVLTAELYGREDDTLIAWQRTCTQLSTVLEAQHAGERLTKALALAQAGAVALEDDGNAVVTSGSARYHVQDNGVCTCPDYDKRGAPCKHALAAIIHSRAVELLEPVPVAAAPTPAVPAAPRRGRPPLHSAPAVPTSASWQVQEAQTSACMRWRIGTMEVTYTIRGTTDAEVIDRIDATVQWLHDLFEVYELRAAERATARTAVLTQALAQAQAPAAAPATVDVHALVQQAVQQALATQSAGHATGHAPAAPPRCPTHGAMRESTKAPGTWFCTQKLADGAFCTSKA